MAAGLGGVYLERMTWLNTARSWRPTLHALTGLAAGVGVGAVLGGLVVIWLAAIWSLVDWPVGGLGTGRALRGGRPGRAGAAALGRCEGSAPCSGRGSAPCSGSRSRPRRAAAAGAWALRPVRAWRAPATWRQLGYHLLALVGGTAGGVLVAACWSAPVLAVAWFAGLLGDGPGVLGRPRQRPCCRRPCCWRRRGWPGAWPGPTRPPARVLLGPSRGEELALRVETLARSRAEIVAATDAERRRIERDLHDGTQRRLVSLAMHLGMARASLTDAPEPVRQVIEQAHDEATEALAELRQLVRGLHPAVLDDRGLDAALSGIAANAPLPVRLRVDVATRCAPAVEAVAYFVVSEALTNVAKHADATHAEVSVERTGDRLHVVITDDGHGGATLAPAGTPPDGGGTGLRGLAQRAAAVDGTLTVESPPGGPTVITVELPCGS